MNGDRAETSAPGSAGTARGWRVVRPLWIVAVAALVAALVPAPATGGGGPGACPAPARPLRYPDVQPIFEQHCAKCHDARKAKNDAAQAVFEMTSYPFSTKRPGTLLDDLRGMFLHRGSLSAEEKCRGTQWLTGGALDAEGKPPRWR
jgi:hypothetical protein